MKKKSSNTVVTNPAATRMPSQRGEFSPDLPPVDAIRPKQIHPTRQITPGSRVTITNPKGNR